MAMVEDDPGHSLAGEGQNTVFGAPGRHQEKWEKIEYTVGRYSVFLNGNEKIIVQEAFFDARLF
jgi:hypothetical protein